MRAGGTWLWPGRLLAVVVRHFFFPHPAAPRVIASVDENPVRPGDKAGLASKAGDAPLHFQKRFLNRVFGIDGVSQQVARYVLHTGTMQRIETLVATHISDSAALRQRCILRGCRSRGSRRGSLAGAAW